jgi:hypothetical protein
MSSFHFRVEYYLPISIPSIISCISLSAQQAIVKTLVLTLITIASAHFVNILDSSPAGSTITNAATSANGCLGNETSVVINLDQTVVNSKLEFPRSLYCGATMFEAFVSNLGLES